MALWLPVAGASGAQGDARFAPRLTIRIPENAQATPPFATRRMQGRQPARYSVAVARNDARAPSDAENLAVGPRLAATHPIRGMLPPMLTRMSAHLPYQLTCGGPVFHTAYIYIKSR
jgi:hypothetical protein